MKIRELVMKRYLIALVGLTVGFAVPVLAQEQNAVGPEVRQQIEDTYKERLDVYNKQDAAGYAAFFTQDAVLVNATGFGDVLVSGQEAIKKMIEVNMVTGSDISGRILQVCAVGSEVCAISEFINQRHQILHAVSIYVRDADEWKIRMQYLTR
jgi:hypothetical protein